MSMQFWLYGVRAYGNSKEFPTSVSSGTKATIRVNYLKVCGFLYLSDCCYDNLHRRGSKH